MTATVAGIHLGLDTHANRPAANTVPDGSMYSCSTHSLIYKSNFAGNSWATWATLGSTGSVATDAIWDAAGDLVQGTGANTAARLALGTAGQVLKVNSGATAVEWGAAGASNPVPWVQAHIGGSWIGTMRTAGGTNRGFYCPTDILSSYTMDGIAIHVGTASGNISVALYDSAAARLATSGSVACPAAGTRKVAFTAGIAVTPGRYYMFLSASDNTATFGFNQYDTSGTALIIGGFEASAHPAPATGTITPSGINMPTIAGYMSGGYL